MVGQGTLTPSVPVRIWTSLPIEMKKLWAGSLTNRTLGYGPCDEGLNPSRPTILRAWCNSNMADSKSVDGGAIPSALARLMWTCSSIG